GACAQGCHALRAYLAERAVVFRLLREREGLRVHLVPQEGPAKEQQPRLEPGISPFQDAHFVLAARLTAPPAAADHCPPPAARSSSSFVTRPVGTVSLLPCIAASSS